MLAFSKHVTRLCCTTEGIVALASATSPACTQRAVGKGNRPSAGSCQGCPTLPWIGHTSGLCLLWQQPDQRRDKGGPTSLLTVGGIGFVLKDKAYTYTPFVGASVQSRR
ncbi:hypothetical protein HPB50_024625 [Hyalomma asiaticum]|uniref:Uncharacterized protein n=1 Tax=Hyalomma asiaticum TaxID=266040 RepID=A0ACB7S9C9_HYAAI|nr:hypothetical protein HPB50_024625 [Hyalomma asiaticum]